MTIKKWKCYAVEEKNDRRTNESNYYPMNEPLTAQPAPSRRPAPAQPRSVLQRQYFHCKA